MKRFYRLPRWLRIFLPAVAITVCLVINAIALTEIRSSLQNRSTPNVYTSQSTPSFISSESQTSESQTSESQTALPLNPDDTLEQAKAKISQTATPTTAPQTAPAPVSSTPVASTSVSSTPISPATPEAASTPPAETSASPASVSSTPVEQAPKYGHFPYPEANPTDMQPVASYAEGANQRAEMLHPDAAVALLSMVAAARADGVWLVPASGFRTIAQQRTLFNAQIAATGSPEAAARISAPPGYSEHHTGYAIDLTDGTLPQSQDISPAFAQTRAFQWMTANGGRFGFELSFGENNPQGIDYEPWHWRYVGSPEAQAIFSVDVPER